MPLYTFYPTRADGLAPSFEAVNLEDDAKAVTEAGRVLEDHEAAAAVVIYRGERKVFTRRRAGELPPITRRPRR